ncbi:MAG: hypothetical protein SF182_28000 [Deltaproteobacteria bacterium]|nr:hypothetical protein [Deltaproteobacteria bacterium]
MAENAAPARRARRDTVRPIPRPTGRRLSALGSTDPTCASVGRKVDVEGATREPTLFLAPRTGAKTIGPASAGADELNAAGQRHRAPR